MFLNNKYTTLYYKIIVSAQERNYIKTLNDGYQTHHIIPRCFGGTDDATNLVVLTYKEHRVCHRLLINMTANDAKYKMMYAYKLFNKQYDTSGAPTPQIYSTPESYIKMVKTRKRQGTYKTGKDNIFSTPEIVEQVRQRMIDNNPMKDPLSQQKRVDTWRANRAARDYIPPRVLKDKFITPSGIFKTKKEIQKVVGIPEWTLNTIYNDLDAYPVTNGRASKKINHLNIDPTKTWRDNGFGLLAVS